MSDYYSTYISPVETQLLSSKERYSAFYISKKRSKIIFDRFFDTYLDIDAPSKLWNGT